jgi:Phosphatidylinositol 3- and 4-kinase
MSEPTLAGVPVPAPLPAEARAGVIACGELELLGRMRYSSNATFLGRAVLDGAEMLVIYKPRRGERPLWDFTSGTLCQREVAAFEVSELLGWGVVPRTVLRDGPHGEGMVQEFVAHDPNEHYLTLRDDHPDRFRAFAAFDVVVNNADRKAGHVLRSTADGSIVGIDHGLTFHDDPKLRTVIWDYIGDVLDDALVDDLRALASVLLKPARTRLADLLSPYELEALWLRVEGLTEEGVLPEPRTDYPYPWPMI